MFKVKKFNWGIASVSFRQNSVEEIINAVKESGLTCIEWGSDVHARPCDEESLNKINYLQENANITTSSYGTYFEIGRGNGVLCGICGYERCGAGSVFSEIL